MKSYKILLVSLFAFFTIGLNAQIFVGGNFGMNFSNGRTEDVNTNTDKPSIFSFNLSPRIGKFLSEKVAAGVSLSFSFDTENNKAAIEMIEKSSGIGITPFLRYYAIKVNKFSAYGQANIGFAYSKSSIKTGATINEGPKNTSLFFNVAPGLAYDLNDHLSLETSINVLSLGFYQQTSKIGSSISHTSSFGMGAGLSNIANTGSLTIGAIYKF